ncbi:hypothetical protein [Streptomyces mirabilis]|uniref:hypothetical protein n=1 Tax=Streptomyces mirabilis TaxID=68239 RepID=UPI00331A6B9B
MVTAINLTDPVPDPARLLDALISPTFESASRNCSPWRPPTRRNHPAYDVKREVATTPPHLPSATWRTVRATAAAASHSILKAP